MLGAPRSAHPLPHLLHRPSTQAVHVYDESPAAMHACGQSTSDACAYMINVQ